MGQMPASSCQEACQCMVGKRSRFGSGCQVRPTFFFCFGILPARPPFLTPRLFLVH